MGLTFADVRPNEPTLGYDGQEFGMAGNLRNQKRIVDITFDSSYPTGGEAMVAADVGLDTISLVLQVEATGYRVQYDRTNSKLLAWRVPASGTVKGPLAQVANAVDLSTLVVRALVIGTKAQSAP